MSNFKEKMKENLLVYAVTDRHWLGQRTLEDVVKESLEGGITFLQLREKHLHGEALLEEAKSIQKLAKAYGIPFVIDDDVEVALAIDADGVHVGQKDMEAQDVRALLGPDKILGVSAQTVEQAIAAEKSGADYLGVGAVFPTNSKDDAIQVPYETVQAICKAVHIPVVAIGGITLENLHELKGCGARGAAVISAIYGQKDILDATQKLKQEARKIFCV